MEYAHLKCPKNEGKDFGFTVWIGNVPRCPLCGEIVPSPDGKLSITKKPENQEQRKPLC